MYNQRHVSLTFPDSSDRQSILTSLAARQGPADSLQAGLNLGLTLCKTRTGEYLVNLRLNAWDSPVLKIIHPPSPPPPRNCVRCINMKNQKHCLLFAWLLSSDSKSATWMICNKGNDRWPSATILLVIAMMTQYQTNQICLMFDYIYIGSEMVLKHCETCHLLNWIS